MAGHTPTPTYKSWCSMLQRCFNKNHDAYPRYGGAGIKVCSKWQDFEGFLADLGERPIGKTLGRVSDVGDYKKGNAFWMTKEEQVIAAMQRNRGKGGVDFNKARRKWRAFIRGKYLGAFDTKKEAMAVRNAAVKALLEGK